MASTIGSLDRSADRIRRGANNSFNNEQSHREYADNVRRRLEEQMAEDERIRELARLKAESIEKVTAEITKLLPVNKLRIKQGFSAVYRQLAWLLPQELKFTKTSVDIVIESLQAVNFDAPLLESWSPEMESLSTEMLRKDEERAARRVLQAKEDEDFINRCVTLIQAMFKAANPDVRNFYKLVVHLRDLITVPRHKGLRGQELIIEAIKIQMPGFAAKWSEIIEKSLERSREREERWRQSRTANANVSLDTLKASLVTQAHDHVKSRDDKWATEAAQAQEYINSEPEITVSYEDEGLEDGEPSAEELQRLESASAELSTPVEVIDANDTSAELSTPVEASGWQE
jgi:hypothetical protein